MNVQVDGIHLLILLMISQNNFNNCSNESFIFWELSGIEGVDWELDPSINSR